VTEASSLAGQLVNLKRALAEAEDPVPVLENALAGRSALVVSCGPSMAIWREVRARLAEEDPVLVCVKQAALEGGESCDLHFLNFSNLQKYPKFNDRVVTFYLGDAEHPLLDRYDVCYSLDGKARVIDDSLSATKAFPSHTLKLTGTVRPWGPGIMFEAVFYTLVHMGIRKITTVGWDIADKAGRNAHFFDTGRPPGVDDGKVNRLERVKGVLRKTGLFGPARRIVLFLRNRVAKAAFKEGKICYKARMVPGEAELVASSVPSLLAWLESEGVAIEIISGSKWMTSFGGAAQGTRKAVPAPMGTRGGEGSP